MSTYAIGDIQGCFTEFKILLDLIHFNADKDTLWFTGDLVNRGPQSLEVLRHIKSLGNQHKIVLGNHDLHLLAVARGVQKPKSKDTLGVILSASDCDELIDWLRTFPLFHYDATLGYAISHAGLAAPWTISKAQLLSHEVEEVLQGHSYVSFLEVLYGDQPDHWDESLTGIDRLRCITNYFTRMRLCYPDGRLELTYKGSLNDKPKELVPWFDVPNRQNIDVKIIFGHWAALGGRTDKPNVFALDTGCVWGNCLTAMRLEDQRRFSIQCG